MKKILLVMILLAIVILIISGSFGYRNVKSLSVKTTTIQVEHGAVIIEIDGCEYIKSQVSSGYTYCHKGNCKNPIHIYRPSDN